MMCLELTVVVGIGASSVIMTISTASKRPHASASQPQEETDGQLEARRVCPHFTREHAARWQHRDTPSSRADSALLLERYLESDAAVSPACMRWVPA
jgi:hypothetical protein